MGPPPTGSADGLGVAAQFDAFLDLKLDLCRALETLADSLPSQLDTHAAMLLVERLRPALAEGHRLEEAMVFPILRTSEPALGPVLDRLRTEHREDEDQAEEVRDALGAFITRNRMVGAEEVGYMLRGLFTSMRRHIAFDREQILPLFRRSCGR